MGRRRQAREMALQALYLMDASGDPQQRAFAAILRKDAADEKTLEFARELVRGTSERREAIDRRIQATAANWSLTRMAAVDRNVLRLASYELLYRRDTPVKVVIDEAIEIARKYSTEDSTKFINGILDKIKEGRPDP